jgi:hypothetical protein
MTRCPWYSFCKNYSDFIKVAHTLPFWISGPHIAWRQYCFNVTYSYVRQLGVTYDLHIDRARLSLNCGHRRTCCSSPRWYEHGEPRWKDIDRGIQKNSEKCLPVPLILSPPQIPHGVNRERPRASTVRGRRLPPEPWYGLLFLIQN